MAANLDDFFAKKDKKRKNKNQSSVLSAETLVRELEEGSRQSEYSSRRDGKTSAAMELLGLDTNDNDWKDFDEVERRDYSGLKVKEMSIQDQEEEHRRLLEKTELAPEIQPWKSKLDTVAAIILCRDEVDVLAPIEETEKQETSVEGTKVESSEVKEPVEDKPATPEVPKKEGDKPSKPAKYVPPHERLDREVQQLEPVRLSKLTGPSSRFHGGKQTPNIEDTKAFPTLG